MIKTLLVDDNALFRERLKDFLAADPAIEIIGEAGDGLEALEKAAQLNPDLVLMDVKMNEMNGLQTTAYLRDKLPNTRVIILSRYDLQEYRQAAKAKGASAYVVKKDLVETLLPAIFSTYGTRRITDVRRES